MEIHRNKKRTNFKNRLMINKFDPLFINSCFTPYLQYFNHLTLVEFIHCRTPIQKHMRQAMALLIIVEITPDTELSFRK